MSNINQVGAQVKDFCPSPDEYHDTPDDDDTESYDDYIDGLVEELGASTQVQDPEYPYPTYEALPQAPAILPTACAVEYATPQPHLAPQEGPFEIEGKPFKTAEELTDEVSEKLQLTQPGVFYADASVKRTGAGVLRLVDGVSEQVGSTGLWSELQKAATFVAPLPNADGEDERDDAPVRHTPISRDFANWICNRAGEFFPSLRGLRSAPFLGPDGRVARTPGYYAETGLYLACRQPRTDVLSPERVGQFFQGLLGDFNFADNQSKLSGLALLFEPFVRPAIIGPTPMHAIQATGIRAGKTYFADIGAGIATGRQIPKQGLPKNEVELPYTIAANLQATKGFALLDNLPDDWCLDSPDLERILTARGPVHIRPARSGQIVAIDTSLVTWALTANQLSLAGGMARRVNPIRLQRQPPDRTYRYPDLHLRVVREHPGVTNAMMWPIEEWIRRGRPEPTSTFPSYPEWSDIVGGVLSVVAEVMGLGGMEAINRWLDGLALQMPPEETEAVLLFEHWLATWPAQWMSSKRVLALLVDTLDLTALATRFAAGKAHGRNIKLGKWLKGLSDSGASVGTGWTLRRRNGQGGSEYLPVPPKVD